MISRLLLYGPARKALDLIAAEAAILLFVFNLRRADEVEALPEGADIVRMLSDYAVLRELARACR